MKYDQVSNRDTRRRRSGVFIVNVEDILHLVLVFLLLSLKCNCQLTVFKILSKINDWELFAKTIDSFYSFDCFWKIAPSWIFDSVIDMPQWCKQLFYAFTIKRHGLFQWLSGCKKSNWQTCHFSEIANLQHWMFFGFLNVHLMFLEKSELNKCSRCMSILTIACIFIKAL